MKSSLGLIADEAKRLGIDDKDYYILVHRGEWFLAIRHNNQNPNLNLLGSFGFDVLSRNENNKK